MFLSSGSSCFRDSSVNLFHAFAKLIAAFDRFCIDLLRFGNKFFTKSSQNPSALCLHAFTAACSSFCHTFCNHARLMVPCFVPVGIIGVLIGAFATIFHILSPNF